jgi:hypothetical protein
MAGQQPHHIARVLEHAQEAVNAAGAARERNGEIWLHADMAKRRLAPVAVDPATDAMLRATLCKEPW